MASEVPPYPNLNDYASCWSSPVECRGSPSFFRSSVIVQVRGAQGMVPLYPCFVFCHGLSSLACWRMAQQRGFQAITPHKQLPQKIACGPLSTFGQPSLKTSHSVCKQKCSSCLWGLKPLWFYFLCPWSQVEIYWWNHLPKRGRISFHVSNSGSDDLLQEQSWTKIQLWAKRGY